jgi:hypothetical protein
LLEDVGGFDVLLRAGEDYDLYLKLARSHPVSHTTVCLADYRIHRTNMSHDTPLMLRASLTVLQKYRELARTRPAWSAAYDSGLSKWQRG